MSTVIQEMEATKTKLGKVQRKEEKLSNLRKKTKGEK